MRFSQAFIPTLREDPASETDAVSSRLMLRSGFTRKLAAGIYEWLPLGFKVLKKVERIIREEMDAIGGQEVWLPVVQPGELWQQSGRWHFYGKELLRLKDRKEAAFCLAPTAEEVITELVAAHARSWRNLPFMLYQFGTKFRDELRPRFGLLRAREFYMKDAYSFHPDEADAQAYYEEVRKAYVRIFDRLGLRYRMVEAETGPIGGSFSHEFMVLADTGEDIIAHCPGCGYAANLERAECAQPLGESAGNNVDAPKDFLTPEKYTVEDVSRFLGIPKDRFVKTLFYWADEKKPVVCLVRGDHELNEAKLKRLLNCATLAKMQDDEYTRACGAPVGFAGPQGLGEKLKKFNAGSKLLADYAVAGVMDGVSGANKKDWHTLHLQYGRDFTVDAFADLRVAAAGDPCVRCAKSTLVFERGIEVGHIFKLGTKYAVSFAARYLDEQGKGRDMVMGCYGIGVSRIVAASLEQNHDEHGMIWPLAIAPYQVALVALEMHEPAVREAAERLYGQLRGEGFPVLFDDRDERAGVKFKDADLIGIPLRATVSRRSLAQGQIELKLRVDKDYQNVSADAALVLIKEKLAAYKL